MKKVNNLKGLSKSMMVVLLTLTVLVTTVITANAAVEEVNSITDEATEVAEITEVTEEIEETEDVANVVNTLESVVTVAASEKITDVTKLLEAITNANSGEVITLDKDFVSSTFTLILTTGKQIIIDGKDALWNQGEFIVNGSGELVLRNFSFDGTSGSTRLLTIANNGGSVTIENSKFINATKGAISIGTPSAVVTTIENTLFDNNTASNAGSAITLSSSANLTIKKSTISNGVGTGGGYPTAAISSTDYAGTLKIENTHFDNNVNKSINTGVFGGGGGAISFLRFTGGLDIVDSYFNGNKTNDTYETTAKATTYDGGAIYIFNMFKTGSVNIDRTTFAENVAWDDGGAILIQTMQTANGDIVDKINITNSTFYKNKAYGVENSSVSGGAIQIYANVGYSGKLTTNINFSGNTFAFNSVGGHTDTASSPGGGALGLSKPGTAFSSTIKANLDNNLFVGNHYITSAGVVTKTGIKANVNTSSYATNGSNNVGYNPTEDTEKQILGELSVKLEGNRTGITAGAIEVAIPTLPILPEGIADNSSTSVISGTDQRLIARFKDSGAIEMTSIKYDSNLGTFKLDALTAYKGAEYYINDSEGNSTVYYSVGYKNFNDTILSSTNLNLSREGYVFLGWSTDKDALVPDSTYNSGQVIPHVDENLELFAIWGIEEKYTVTYHGNENTGGTEPSYSDPFEAGTDVVILDSDSLVKDGHTFTGWNTKDDGTGTVFYPDDVIEAIDQNYDLYAIWEKDKYTINYHCNGGTLVNPETVDYLDVFSEPDNPTREGYDFNGWFIDEEFVEQYDFATEAVADVDVFAKWDSTDDKTPDTSVKQMYTYVFSMLVGMGLLGTLIIMKRKEETQ